MDEDLGSLSSLTHYPSSSQEWKRTDSTDLAGIDEYLETFLTAPIWNDPELRAPEISTSADCAPTSGYAIDDLGLLPPISEPAVARQPDARDCNLLNYSDCRGVTIDSFENACWNNSADENRFPPCDISVNMFLPESVPIGFDSKEKWSSASISGESKAKPSILKIRPSKPPTVPKQRGGKKACRRTRSEIRIARAERNRASARRSRLRKKAESQREKERAAAVQMLNKSLTAHVSQLRDRIYNLREIARALGLESEIEKTEQDSGHDASSAKSENTVTAVVPDFVSTLFDA